jgi:glutamate--cysteine ligase
MTPLLDRAALVEHFDSGFRPREKKLIGLEYELLGVDRETGVAIPYDGRPGSVVSVLRRMCSQRGWNPVGGEPLLELERDGSRITLEPGAQIELSARALASLSEVREELWRFLGDLFVASEGLGILWIPLGIQPLSTPGDIEIIPKQRYDIMTRYLPRRGSLALWMMRTTAGMQVNLDVESPQDAARKLRLALRLCPMFTAMFANSPVSGGAANGFATRRGQVWREVDPDRCGVPSVSLAEDATTADYVDWALDAGMFFIERDGRLVDMTGTRFREFLASGRDGLTATIEDWKLHLTTLFPEARLKSYLELRCADSCRPALALAYAALATGLIYGSDDELRRVEDLVGSWSAEEISAFHDAATREGLSAVGPGGVQAAELARELLAIAGESLDRVLPGERSFLQPLIELAGAARSPSDELLDSWRGSVPEWLPTLGALAIGART